MDPMGKAGSKNFPWSESGWALRPPRLPVPLAHDGYHRPVSPDGSLGENDASGGRDWARATYSGGFIDASTFCALLSRLSSTNSLFPSVRNIFLYQMKFVIVVSLKHASSETSCFCQSEL